MKKVDGLDIVLGEAIKSLRIEKGLSQEELAEKCDSSALYISEIERGIKNPTITTLIAIALSLDMKLSELIIELERALSTKILDTFRLE